jgi:hypothetical protein
MKQMFVAVLACATLLSAQIVGAAGPTGIAFVEAPEMSFGVCAADNPDKAFACARERCVKGGAPTNACARRAWCYPSGWSVDVFMQHKEGPHWHQYSCGWPSLEAAKKAAEVLCDRELAPYLMECTPVRFFNPSGVEQKQD